MKRLDHANPVLEPDQQYAVVLLNEDQLSQFMRRPNVRQVNRGYTVPDVHSRYVRLRRQTAAAAAVVIALATGTFLYFMAPQPAMASMFAWKDLPKAPTLDTGASFSVTVASLDSSDAAGMAASRLRSLGMPVFTRVSPGRRQLHQAMAGPFASLDEAERAQRRLTRSGFPAARIFVDESLRNAPRNDLKQTAIEGNPNVLLIGAPDRVSLVFELPLEPRQVRSRREENLLDIDVGPVDAKVREQHWSAPEGVHLVERVTIEGVQASETGQFLRAHLTLPEFARANVRSEGRRVYVDLTWPLTPADSVAPRQAFAIPQPNLPMKAEPSRAVAIPEPSEDEHAGDKYTAAVGPVFERFTALKPFLMSAVQSGQPDVIGALDETLASLELSLKSMKAPATALDQHQMLMSAVHTARKATDISYAGDRMAQAREAFVLLDAAANTASLTPVVR